jgi:hypothetical protein
MVASILPNGGRRGAIAARNYEQNPFAKRRHRDLVVGLRGLCVRILAFPEEARSLDPSGRGSES